MKDLEYFSSSQVCIYRFCSDKIKRRLRRIRLKIGILISQLPRPDLNWTPKENIACQPSFEASTADNKNRLFPHLNPK